VRANKGAAGIDQPTIVDVEQYGSPGCLASCPRISRTAATGRCRPAGCTSPSLAGRASKGRCRFLLSAIASFKAAADRDRADLRGGLVAVLGHARVCTIHRHLAVDVPGAP
jgi:hypothetical protein